MRRTMFAFAVVLGVCGLGTSAVAYPGLTASVMAQYPDATRLNNCGTCHTDFITSGGGLNPYGTAYLNADGLSDPAGAMTAIEGTDSDGDGTTNGVEMTTGAGFLPGWTCDTAQNATNAPGDILDFVDPTDIGCTGGGTTTTVTTTTTLGVTTTTSGGTTTTIGSTTTTTVPGEPKCSQPVTSGPSPLASDCLFILRAAVGSSTCDPTCICNVNSADGITATDAQICLKKAVGQGVELNCSCGVVTTTTTTLPPPTSTTTVPATTSTTVTPSTTVTTTPPTTSTTTGGGNIAAGQALYDAQCSFCHAAGAHDPNAEFASDLAGDGNKLVPDLSSIDGSMQIMLTEQQIADLAAFLDSL